MFYYKKVSKEECLFIDILFRNKALVTVLDINYEKLVHGISSHLMLPSFYVRLKRKNQLNFLPKELSEYFKEIYVLNEKRNKILKKEIAELSKILNSNKINYVFLKGSAMILDNIFHDIGERMIGDIDILVSEEQVEDASNLLKSKGYTQVPKYYYFKQRHAPRLKNKEKLFAIEIHRRIVDRDPKKKLPTDIILKNKSITNNGIAIINSEFLLLHCVYNYMLNDYGSDNARYSYKTFYDFNRIIEKYPSFDKKILNDDIIKKYLIMSNGLGITNFNIKYDLGSILFKYKFYMINNYKSIYVFNKKLFKIIRFIRSIPIKTWEFLKNSSYRRYVYLKITNKL